MLALRYIFINRWSRCCRSTFRVFASCTSLTFRLSNWCIDWCVIDLLYVLRSCTRLERGLHHGMIDSDPTAPHSIPPDDAAPAFSTGTRRALRVSAVGAPRQLSTPVISDLVLRALRFPVMWQLSFSHVPLGLNGDRSQPGRVALRNLTLFSFVRPQLQHAHRIYVKPGARCNHRRRHVGVGGGVAVAVEDGDDDGADVDAMLHDVEVYGATRASTRFEEPWNHGSHQHQHQQNHQQSSSNNTNGRANRAVVAVVRGYEMRRHVM